VIQARWVDRVEFVALALCNREDVQALPELTIEGRANTSGGLCRRYPHRSCVGRSVSAPSSGS